MSFTYTPGSSDATVKFRNRIRRLIGDTVSGNGPRFDGSNFTDEEIAEVIVETSTTNAYLVGAELLTILASEWTSVANVTVGPRSEQYGDRAREYRAQAAELQAQAGSGKLYAGALSADRKLDVETDTDRVAPSFTRDWGKHP